MPEGERQFLPELADEVRRVAEMLAAEIVRITWDLPFDEEASDMLAVLEQLAGDEEPA